jgi:hypothetical protein
MMTISEARAMQADDVALTEDDVARLEDQAAEAEENAAVLERSAVEGGKGSAAPGAVVEARAVAEFARQRAGRMRASADRAEAARRLLALEAVGKTVEQIHLEAAQPDAGMVAALTAITSAYATLRQLADAHNGKIRDAVDLARSLGAEPAAPNGPRASSAHIVAHRGNRKIQSGSVTVQMVDKRTIDEAVELAVKGKPDDAVRRLNAAHTIAAPKRRDHYYLQPNGLVQGQDDADTASPKTINFPARAAKGEVRELSPDEVEAYLQGRLHGHQAGT